MELTTRFSNTEITHGLEKNRLACDGVEVEWIQERMRGEQLVIASVVIASVINSFKGGLFHRGAKKWG